MMTYNPQKHNRQSTRLKGHDYASPGWYFVTICTHNRQCLFGQIDDGNMQLNKFGKIAHRNWLHTESIRDNVILDEFIIMPNHMHGIIAIVNSKNIVGAYRDTPLRNTSPENDNPEQPGFRSPSKTLGAIVRGYKSAVTKQINQIRNSPGEKIWQRNYYDHIIRDEPSLQRIRYYINNNPAQWQNDRNNPQNF